MKIILTKNRNNWCEDCCDGLSTGLSPLIYQTGAYLRRQGLDVTVREYDQSPKDILEDYDCIALFVSLAGLDENLGFLKMAKERGLWTVLVLHDSFWVEQELMSQFDFIDYCILYPEREITLKELLFKLETGKPETIPGTIGRKNGKPCFEEMRPPRSDLSHLGSCSEILSPVLLQHTYTHAYLTAGRGCPHGCSFCDIRRTPVRKRAPEDIIDEMATLQRVKALRTGISLIDPLFGADLTWTERLCERILHQEIEVTWRASTRYDALPDLPLLRHWKRAGCIRIGLGLEHLHDPVLKKVNLEEFRKAVLRLQKASILPVISVIIGLWEDNDTTLEELKGFLVSLGKIEVLVTPLMPLKGTPLYDDYRSRHLIPELSYRDYQDWGYANVMFPTERLTKGEIDSWMNRLRRIHPSSRGRRPWNWLTLFWQRG